MRYEHTQRVSDEILSVLKESLEGPIRSFVGDYLKAALEEEAGKYVSEFERVLDQNGKRMVVRNGTARPRQIATAAGVIRVEQPRVNDRREGRKYKSSILPPYLRRTKEVDDIIPLVYLLGVSTNNMSEAIGSILGAEVALSPATVSHIIQRHVDDWNAWKIRSLEGKRYVYWWCDGIYVNVRLSGDKSCLLTIIGVTEDGTKELVGVWDGKRESKESWLEFLRDMRARGLQGSPELAIGDGALGMWSAMEEIMPETEHQMCTVHKTRNVLNALPKKLQAQAKEHLREIFDAANKEEAELAWERFRIRYQEAHPKAYDSLNKHKEKLLRFYDYPPRHWKSIRSTNIIESCFSTVRHRTRQTKGAGTSDRAVAMVVAMARRAERSWRTLDALDDLKKVSEGTWEGQQTVKI